jgi:hypothetical protein
MRPKGTKGKCSRCGKEYTRAGMAKHLAKCLTAEGQATKGERKNCLHLQVSAKFTSAYWLHLQVDADATLKTLDGFLRDIWLECCGHMSMFHVGHREIGMNRKLSSLFSPGTSIEYDYDMGDTTSLEIKAMNSFQGMVAPGKAVAILARNQPPEIACDSCGKGPAVRICPECQWEGEGGLCKTCAANHECGDEEYLLPVVNSPRTGVCGYVG